jgi:hypothetical protein
MLDRIRICSALVVVALMGTIPGSLWAAEVPLKVVGPPDPGEFVVTRGQRHAREIILRNESKEPIAIESLGVGKSGAPKDLRDLPPGPDDDKDLPDVVGLEGMTLAAGQTSSVTLILPPIAETGDYAGGLYLKSTGGELDRVFYSFKVKVKEPPGNYLSPKKSGILAALLALGVLVLALFLGVKDPAGEKWNVFRSPDGTYSVSRFQVGLWTVTILFSYAYLFFSQGNPDFPDSLWGLLGISIGSIGVSTTLAVKSDAAARSFALRDGGRDLSPIASMLSEDGKPSVMRLQMLAWTIATAVFFVAHVYATGTLWDVPDNLLILMGVSHGGYLVDKAVQKPPAPPQAPGGKVGAG